MAPHKLQGKRLQSKVIYSGVLADSDDDSPEAVKREGKPATERPAVADIDAALNQASDTSGRRRRLQDPLPLEASADGSSLAQPPVVIAESKSLGTAGVDQPYVNPTYVPRSGYYFQHDDRGAPSGGRSNKRRAYVDRTGWNELRAKSRPNEHFRDNTGYMNQARSDDRRWGESQNVSQNNVGHVWCHDKFHEAQAENLGGGKPLKHGKGAFAEEGSLDAKPADGNDHGEEGKVKVYQEKAGKMEEHKIGSYKRAEGRRNDTTSAKREREHFQERRKDVERGRWMETDQRIDRFPTQAGSCRSTSGRDRWGRRVDGNERNSHRNRIVVEKWKHDMFDDANRSPTPKQEENHIANIEALLST